MSETKYKVSIGFSRPKKWKPLAWLIMKFTGNFSHTFTTWKCTNIQARKVFEAVGSGVRIISNHRFREKAFVVDVFSFEVSDEVIFWLDRYTHEQAGKPYGYKHILGLAYVILMGCVGVKVKNPFKDGRYSEICLESGAHILEQALGIDLPGDIEDYTLKEFYQIVAEHGGRAPQEKIDIINRKK